MYKIAIAAVLFATNARAFFDAIASKDLERLKPIYGRDKVLRLMASLVAKPGIPPRWMRGAVIDGLPDFIATDHFADPQATAVAIKDGNVIAFYTVRNPDKLRHVESLVSGRDRRGQRLH